MVFGEKGKEQRQYATQEQLAELSELQMQLAFAIDRGYIKTWHNLMEECRKIYSEKKGDFEHKFVR